MKKENVINEMKIIGEIISKAEKYGLLTEVIDTAIHIAKSWPELSVSEIISESGFQWDIIGL